MMQDLKLSEAETQEGAAKMAEPPKERYPYGCRITLDDKTLEKMGIKDVPKAGMKFEIEALATVEDTHQRSSKEGGENRSVTLQLTHLALDEDAAEDEGDDEKSAKALYSEGGDGAQG